MVIIIISMKVLLIIYILEFWGIYCLLVCKDHSNEINKRIFLFIFSYLNLQFSISII